MALHSLALDPSPPPQVPGRGSRRLVSRLDVRPTACRLGRKLRCGLPAGRIAGLLGQWSSARSQESPFSQDYRSMTQAQFLMWFALLPAWRAAYLTTPEAGPDLKPKRDGQFRKENCWISL